MATKAVVSKEAKKELWARARKELSHPLFLTNIGVIVTGTWLMPGFVYFFLWTYKLVPSGAIVYCAVAILATTGILGIGSMIISWVRFARAIKPYARPARFGDENAKQEMVRLRKSPPKIQGFFLFHLCMLLLIAPCVSITLANTFENDALPIRIHGKVRPWTRSDYIDSFLKAMQKR